MYISIAPDVPTGLFSNMVEQICNVTSNVSALFCYNCPSIQVIIFYYCWLR